MNFSIETRNDIPAYSYLIDLQGGQFELAFNFNGRMDRWLFSIRTASGDPILTNIVIVANRPLIGQYADPRLPAGDFIAFDTSGAGIDPGRFDLGARVMMVYNV